MMLFATIIAGAAFTVAGVAQIVRLIRTGSARDVSFWFVTLLGVGVISLWSVVIFGESSLYLKVERSVNLCIQVALWAVVVYYKRKDYINAHSQS